jgi:hypothetical protein
MELPVANKLVQSSRIADKNAILAAAILAQGTGA